MEFEDRPAPGRGYLWFIHLVIGGSMLVVILVTISMAAAEPVAVFAVGHAAIVIGLAYWMILHAAYRTSYTIRGDKLNVRSGIFKSVIRLYWIKGIQPARYNRKILGWGIGCRGFCNRFRDGVVIKTDREKVFLSPSNPDIFIDHIRGMLPDQKTNESLLNGSRQ